MLSGIFRNQGFLEPTIELLHRSGYFMPWNLFLALLPFLLSLWLFQTQQRRSLFWWLGLGTFVAFLPNAPYVLTDTIHLLDLVADYPFWVIGLILIPQYLCFTLAGFAAYVMAVINLGKYLDSQGLGKYILPVEILLHSLCALGIYLGREERFNSWDLVTNLNKVLVTVKDDLSSSSALLAMIVTFLSLVCLYGLGKILWRKTRVI